MLVVCISQVGAPQFLDEHLSLYDGALVFLGHTYDGEKSMHIRHNNALYLRNMMQENLEGFAILHTQR